MIRFAALSALIIFSAVSTAGTLTCTGEGLSLSEKHNDGGAHIIATIQLVIDGQLLVDEGLGRPDLRQAYYSLNGNPKNLTKPVRKNDLVTVYFKQQLTVNSTQVPNPAILFMGEVVCREVTYVGPPRP